MSGEAGTRTRHFRGGFTLRRLETSAERHPTRDVAEAEAIRMLADRPGAGIIICQEVACVKSYLCTAQAGE
ncbi:hypothetical protein [uncultured Sphingomonas sp.]|uniref:hypothetical protein n=1 Tax=uncultured Sphingomonas sp. TaxID=158754 RepID=UPI00263781D6|nr:hypothetical protein [uncultured Sphingomonas sp.]